MIWESEVLCCVEKSDGKSFALTVLRYCRHVILLKVVGRRSESSGSEEGDMVGSGLFCEQGFFPQRG